MPQAMQWCIVISCSNCMAHTVSCVPVWYVTIVNVILFTDASLTVDNVSKVMELVSSADKIMEVWEELDIPETMISGTTKEETRACVDLYLNCRPYVASWMGITKVLYDRHEMTAARVAKLFYPQNG